MFRYYNKVDYKIDEHHSLSSIDITTRTKINDYIFRVGGAGARNYLIQEGERPEGIANRLYGRPSYAYILLLSNNIHNLYDEWPKDSETFKKYIIENLIEKFGKDKIEYLGQIERLEVLDLIKKSKIALNTTHEGGWGFIGECFAVGTLLLYTRNHYLFNHNYDSFHLNFTLSDRDDLNDILSNEELYHKLQENMICRYNNEHSAKSIGSKYFDLIKTTLLENE